MHQRVLTLAGLLLFPIPVPAALSAAPVAWWSFDSVLDAQVLDSARQTWDTLQGNHAFPRGVRGNCLRLDGSTTHASARAAAAPRFAGPFTIQAWVALQTLPWNWTAILDQGTGIDSRLFFGIDAHGRVGIRLRGSPRDEECISSRALPLLKWNLLTATFDENKGLRIFVNGESWGSSVFKLKLPPGDGAELLIGRSRRKMGPEGSEREASGNWPSEMVLHGLLDELRIYDQELSPEQIASQYNQEKPAAGQPLQWQPMPSGPAGLPQRFDAIYTRLRYTDEWEAPWRVGDDPDILVSFDLLPVRLLFWRGTGYGGVWVTENGLWMADQSLERAGEGKSAWGCAEHMSDKQARYGTVRIIEKNAARIVLHWRYAVADITYAIFGAQEPGAWGEWADEYFFIYPDGVSTRYQTLWTEHLSHEWQETIVLNQPGTRPEDNVALGAMTLANMDGDQATYSWEKGPPAAFSRPANPNIQVTNLRSRFRPFIIFEPGPAMKPFRSAIRPEVSHFPWWNHWPVAQVPNDGRRAMGPDRPSHSSLSQSVEESPVIHRETERTYTVVTLTGMTDRPIAELVSLARAWNRAPALSLSGSDFVSSGYDKNQRAFVLERKAPATTPLLCRIASGPDSPLVNPAFVVRNWRADGTAVKLNGRALAPGRDFRAGIRRTMEGDDLVIWLRLSVQEPVTFEFRPVVPAGTER